MKREMALGLVGLVWTAWGCQKNTVEVAQHHTLPDAAQTAGLTSAATPWVKLQPSAQTPLFEGPAQILPSPGSIANVMPVFSAQVTKLLVQPGQRVAAGEPVCIVLAPEVLRAAGSLVGAGLRLQAHLQRKEQLLALKNEGLARLSDQLETDARIAEAKATQLEATAVLQAAGVSAHEAATFLQNGGKITLRSPIAGVVVSVSVNLGNVVSPGTALLKIVGAQDHRIEARLLSNVPEHARFELRLPSGKRMPLRLLERSPQADSRDGTRLSWLVVEEGGAHGNLTGNTPATSEAELVPGLWGKVVVLSEPQQGKDKSYVVPSRALKIVGTGAQIFRRGARDQPEPVSVRVQWSSSVEALVSAPELRDDDWIAQDASQHQLSGVGGVER